METFRNKLEFVFYKPPNTRSNVLPAAHEERVVLGFLSRWRAQQHIPIPAFLPKLPHYPASSNTCYKIFHAYSVLLEVQEEKNTGTIKGCAQQHSWHFQSKRSPPPLRYLQKNVCFMDTIQGTATTVQLMTPQIWCKWMDSWDSSGQLFFSDFIFYDMWCFEDGVLLLLLHTSSLWLWVKRRLFQASHKEMH